MTALQGLAQFQALRIRIVAQMIHGGEQGLEDALLGDLRDLSRR